MNFSLQRSALIKIFGIRTTTFTKKLNRLVPVWLVKIRWLIYTVTDTAF